MHEKKNNLVCKKEFFWCILVTGELEHAYAFENACKLWVIQPLPSIKKRKAHVCQFLDN